MSSGSSSSSQQVSNEVFLSKLTPLLEATKSAHSVYISQKRVSKGNYTSTSSSSSRWPVVFRVTDGKGKAAQGRTKYSTQVNPEELLSFQERCTTILRTSFASFLKKRDKAKERRTDKMLKDLRKRMENTGKVKVTSIGSNRGAGRRKRAQAKRKAFRIKTEQKRSSKAAKVTTTSSATAATAAIPQK